MEKQRKERRTQKLVLINEETSTDKEATFSLSRKGRAQELVSILFDQTQHFSSLHE